MKRGYRHSDGSYEVVTFVTDTATARAFYSMATEISVASAQAGLDAAENVKPKIKSQFEKLLDQLQADGVISKAKIDAIKS